MELREGFENVNFLKFLIGRVAMWFLTVFLILKPDLDGVDWLELVDCLLKLGIIIWMVDLLTS